MTKNAVADDSLPNDKPNVSASAEKVNLLGMSEQKLTAFFESLGEKRFRVKPAWCHRF